MLSKLQQIWRDNTGAMLENCIPLPQPATAEERLAWRKTVCDQLEKSAANGDTTFEIVFATTTYHKDTGESLTSLPRPERNDACCIFPYDIEKRAYKHYLYELSATNAKTRCVWCKKANAVSFFGPKHRFITMPPLLGFDFSIKTCATPKCVEAASAEATKRVIACLLANGYRLETTVHTDPSDPDEPSYISPFCPLTLAQWLAVNGHEDTGCIMPSPELEETAILRFGTLLQDYARQLIWPEMDVPVAFSRIRSSMSTDGPTVSHYVDHGLFFDWSFDEPANKKSKTSE